MPKSLRFAECKSYSTKEHRYLKEAEMKRDVLSKLESMKLELRALECGEVTLEGIWRQK